MDEVQYCVILREGIDAGLKQYFWVSKEKIEKGMEKIINGFRFATSDKRAYFDIDYITGNKGDRVSVAKGMIGSLQIYSDNKKTLKNCFEKVAECWGIDIV